MKNINLSSNHNRSVSSSVYLIEQLADEIATILNNNDDGIIKTVRKDTAVDEKKNIMIVLGKIRTSLKKMTEKYSLAKHEIVQSQYISARKVKMWEVLNDTTSKRLKGFGDFPEEYAGEFDQDIRNLITLVEKI